MFQPVYTLYKITGQSHTQGAGACTCLRCCHKLKRHPPRKSYIPVMSRCRVCTRAATPPRDPATCVARALAGQSEEQTQLPSALAAPHCSASADAPLAEVPMLVARRPPPQGYSLASLRPSHGPVSYCDGGGTCLSLLHGCLPYACGGYARLHAHALRHIQRTRHGERKPHSPPNCFLSVAHIMPPRLDSSSSSS
jgi:hypothetical protein